jgi:hypothetical protein
MAIKPTPPLFPRRHNADGTIDSICSRCFETVATAKTEEELRKGEDAHRCSRDLSHLTFPPLVN